MIHIYHCSKCKSHSTRPWISVVITQGDVIIEKEIHKDFCQRCMPWAGSVVIQDKYEAMETIR